MKTLTMQKQAKNLKEVQTMFAIIEMKETIRKKVSVIKVWQEEVIIQMRTHLRLIIISNIDLSFNNICYTYSKMARD